MFYISRCQSAFDEHFYSFKVLVPVPKWKLNQIWPPCIFQFDAQWYGTISLHTWKLPQLRTFKTRLKTPHKAFSIPLFGKVLLSIYCLKFLSLFPNGNLTPMAAVRFPVRHPMFMERSPHNYTDIKTSPNCEHFMKRLKTHLCSIAFSNISLSKCLWACIFFYTFAR